MIKARKLPRTRRAQCLGGDSFRAGARLAPRVFLCGDPSKSISEEKHADRSYALLVSLVTHRPIAWVTSLSLDRHLNGSSPIMTDAKRVCEDSSHLVCKKTRARLLQSSRFHHLCRFISWEIEELDERPHALFLTAALKSLGSC
jgi:hypothetical protein